MAPRHTVGDIKRWCMHYALTWTDVGWYNFTTARVCGSYERAVEWSVTRPPPDEIGEGWAIGSCCSKQTGNTTPRRAPHSGVAVNKREICKLFDAVV